MSWDFIKITYRVAAKDHRCAECRTAIPKGAKHVYTSGKVEGRLHDYRLCLPCYDLAQAAIELIPDMDEGWSLGNLRRDLAEVEVGPDQYADFIAEAAVQRRMETRRDFCLSIGRKAVEDVVAERENQRKVKGFSWTHDDGHDTGELALAAATFAAMSGLTWASNQHLRQSAAALFPFDHPPGEENGDPRALLVKAGALILAEIERIDRRSAEAAS